jgi:hypothetical protein
MTQNIAAIQAEHLSSSTTTTVDFYFDPGCPWAWISSRWILEAAAVRSIEVQWRAYSLGMLNEGHDNPDFVDKRAMARKALRVVEALAKNNRYEEIGAFYTEMGERFHVQNEPACDELMIAAAKSAGIEDMLDIAFDESWDGAVRDALDAAVDIAGPDTGAPVIAWGDPRQGIFGPVVSPAPTGEEAGRVWDGVVALTESAGFFELKRGRHDPADFS